MCYSIPFFLHLQARHITPLFQDTETGSGMSLPRLRSHSQEEEGSEFKPRLIQSPGFALSSAYGTPNTITLIDRVLTSRHRGGRKLVTVPEFRQKDLTRGRFFLLFWLHCVACGISVYRPRIEPVTLALQARSPNHWASKEAPSSRF